MASNSFGNLFKIMTWGESHGPAIGVVIDGCPAGLKLTVEDINQALKKRAPGQNALTSPRKESDKAQLLSGIFEGITTGAPISILIPNLDADSSKYEAIKDLLRPGHANFTYLEKYGVFDWRGGGRASARETAARVAAGAVAKKLLKHVNIEVRAFIKEIGDVVANSENLDLLNTGWTLCPDLTAEKLMVDAIEKAKREGDSLGGVVEFIAWNVPPGLGDPIYEKLEANLAHAMLSIPATKGFEIGSGFSGTKLPGSIHNDPFTKYDDRIMTSTNNAGGILGGISTGMPLTGKVAFKPTSSIYKNQNTTTLNGQEATLTLPEGSRHDPCVAIRGVAVVEAMLALVLADSYLLNRAAKL